MLNAEDLMLQDYLADYVVSLGDPDALFRDGGDDSGVVSLFNQLSRERLKIYRQSFAGRVFMHLPKLALAPLCRALGDDFMVELTARFFHSISPQNKTEKPIENSRKPQNPHCMVSAIQGLPDYVRKNSPNEYGQLIGDLVELALLRWQILQGPDFFGQLQHRAIATTKWVLSPGHELMIPKGSIDLFGAWSRCDQSSQSEDFEKCDFEKYINKQPTGILLVKTESTTVVSIEIKETYFDFFRSLKAGRDLYKAVSEMPIVKDSKQKIDQIDQQQFFLFLMKLKQMGVLVRDSAFDSVFSQ